MRIVGDKHLVYDKNGYLLVDGKPYDERGYEVKEDENGEKVFYD